MAQIKLENGPEIITTVQRENRFISPQEDYRLGKLEPGNLILSAHTPCYLHGVMLEQSNGVTYARRAPCTENGKSRHHFLDITVEKNGDEHPFVSYPQNSLCLLRVSPEGQLRMWSMGIVSDNGEFSIQAESIGAANAYLRANGLIVVPDSSLSGIDVIIWQALGGNTGEISSYEEHKKKNMRNGAN